MLAGVPIGLAYVWYGLFQPLLSDEATDFVNTYLAGARVLASGGDPYQCNVGLCGGHPHYLLFYPPLPFWLAQPLIGFDEKVVAGVALVVANVFLLCFVWLVVRALRARDPQFTLIVLLASISFPPTLTEVQNRNLQVAVLMLSAVLLLAWLSGDRWWGGLALGVGLAIMATTLHLLVSASDLGSKIRAGCGMRRLMGRVVDGGRTAVPARIPAEGCTRAGAGIR